MAPLFDELLALLAQRPMSDLKIMRQLGERLAGTVVAVDAALLSLAQAHYDVPWAAVSCLMIKQA